MYLMNKYTFDMDLRHVFLGIVLLICLAVITVLAGAGLSLMEKQQPDALDFNLFYLFLNIWGVLGVLVLPSYIIFFTKFNNSFKRKEDKK